MASKKQTEAARRNIKLAQGSARAKKTITNLPSATRTALGKQERQLLSANALGRVHERPGLSSTRSPNGGICRDAPEWVETRWPQSSERSSSMPSVTG